MIRTPGFVVEANANEQWVRNFITTKHPTTMLFINRSDLASLAADLGVPNVILRIKTDSLNDDILHVIFRDALEWWNVVKHHYTDKRLIVYVGNELNGDWSKIGRFLHEALVIISESGRRGVYGNFGVGNPEPQYWSTFLSGFISLLNQKDNQYLGLHEYYLKHPFLGVDGYTWNGNQVVNVTPNIPIKDRTKWILGRYEFALRVAPNLKIMITEFGADHVQAIANQFGFPASLRGWDSQYNGNENATVEDYKLAINTFFTNKAIHGILFFIVGGFGWEDFDYTNAHTILDRWNEFRTEIKMGVAVNKLVEIKAKANSYNMRFTAPNGQIVGATSQSVPDWTLVTYLEYEDNLDSSGIRWSRYSGLKLASGSIGSAWIRDDGVERRDFVDPNPQPEPDDKFITLPVPELFYGNLTDREKEIIVSLYKSIGLYAETLANWISENNE